MLNFGIIGCGVIAPSHVKAIKETNGKANLYAVCDIVEDKAKNFMQTHGAKKYYTDYKKMLQDSLIDVVCICTPSGAHGQIAIDAAAAKKHILCEKPIEITTEKIDEMIKAVNNNGVKMSCVFQRRTQKLSLKVKKAIDDNIFGKPLVADAYLKSWRSREYYLSADWRATWELDGGGALMNQGIHGVDLISWFMDGVENVSAEVSTKYHNIEVEDTAFALVKYKNGALGVIQATTCVQPAQEIRFEIHFEKGSIIFDDTGILQWGTEVFSASNGDSVLKSNPAALEEFSHTPIMLDLIESIEQDKDVMLPPEEGRKAVDLILAIYKSSKLGRRVTI